MNEFHKKQKRTISYQKSSMPKQTKTAIPTCSDNEVDIVSRAHQYPNDTFQVWLRNMVTKVLIKCYKHN